MSDPTHDNARGAAGVGEAGKKTDGAFSLAGVGQAVSAAVDEFVVRETNKKSKPEPKLEVHPIARLLPEMTSGEKTELQRDIKKHGQRQPIILYGGKILDGRHRYAACRELGVTPRTEEFKGDASAATALVLSLNLHRRHLNQEQKRELVKALVKVDPKASDRSIAKTAKVDHKTVAKVRSAAVDGGEIPHHAERIGVDGVAQPIKKTETSFVRPLSGEKIAAAFRESNKELPPFRMPKAVDEKTSDPDDADVAEIRYVWKKISPRARRLFVDSLRHEIKALLGPDEAKQEETTSTEQQRAPEQQIEVTPPARKRGRPKGSKNKPKVDAAPKQEIKRKRGRPKQVDIAPSAGQIKRKPGRPKGSKNRPKPAARLNGETNAV